MEKLAKFVDNPVIGRVGFYELMQCSECIRKGLSVEKGISSGVVPSEIPSKQQIIGIYFHDIVSQTREAKKIKDLEKASAEIIKRLSAKYHSFIKRSRLGPIESWKEIGHALHFASNMRSSPEIKFECANKSEESLASRDGHFKGRPDFFSVHGRNATIIEYKSGRINDQNEARPIVKKQLQYYAVLLVDKFTDLEVVKVKALGLNKDVWSDEWSIGEISGFHSEFSALYTSIEKSAKAGNLESPNPLICPTCSFKTICLSYISIQHEIESKLPIYVKTGILSDYRIIKESADGHIVSLFVGDSKIDVDLFETQLEGLSVGKQVSLINLYLKKSKLYWSDFSEIYES